MRRLRMISAILIIAVPLMGCGESKAPKPPMAKLNPPPKPPNCPASPEMKNITLKDGSIADVRILRDEDVTFYIPASWYRWTWRRSNVAKDWSSPGSRGPEWSAPGSFAPDINPIECPGTVHIWNMRQTGFGITTPEIAADRRTPPPPNFSSESDLYSLFIGNLSKSRDVFGRLNYIGNEHLHPFGIGVKGVVKLGTNQFAVFRYYNANPPDVQVGPVWDKFEQDVFMSARWKSLTRSMKMFYDWLKTPPARRDNDQIFQFGDLRNLPSGARTQPVHSEVVTK
jgi:hypothetical protein